MADIFREVDEDLRRERAARIWRRFGPVFITAAVLTVAATAGYVAWQRWQTARNQEQTAELGRALAQALPAGASAPATNAADLLAGVAARTDGAHASLARFYEAGLRVRQGDREGAVAIYDQLAGTESDPVFRDLAQLLAVLHQVDSGDPKQLLSQLTPLTGTDNPWNWSARELAGLLSARSGDTARARELFSQLADDPQTPAGIRARATELADFYAPPK